MATLRSILKNLKDSELSEQDWEKVSNLINFKKQESGGESFSGWRIKIIDSQYYFCKTEFLEGLKKQGGGYWKGGDYYGTSLYATEAEAYNAILQAAENNQSRIKADIAYSEREMKRFSAIIDRLNDHIKRLEEQHGS